MNNLKSYASYFVSYFLDNLNNVNFEKIILFGSVAREEATKESDIDIFIEIKKENKKLEIEIKKILENFYKSREALLFKAKRIDNKINLIIGKLEEWKDLRDSIENTGIILYGKYIPEMMTGKNLKKYSLISWEKIGKNRGAFLNRVYGFKVRDKIYDGLIKKLNGKKLGKSSIAVPAESSKEILDLLGKYKVEAKVINIYLQP